MRDETLLRSTAARYAFSVAAVAAAFALKILLMPWTGSGPPLVFAFAAILVTSIFAGPGPAVLALVITVPLGALILPAGYSDSQALVQASLYLIDGLIIVYLTSLTNRRRVSLQHANQRLLTANQERARALTRTRETIDLAPDAYFLADLDGHLSDVNQAACRLLA
jgi:PAS domain-containing protein